MCRHGGCRFRRIDRDAHQFGAGLRQFLDLNRRADRIRVSVLVIDCTRTGASPPIVTRLPAQRTSTACEDRRGAWPPNTGSLEEI
jgi:hypothetical protein